jgi:hypothetical protein
MSELSSRKTFSLIKQAYAQKGRNPITTASTLRLIQPVASSKTLYTFPVLQGDTPGTYAEEILLNRADSFTVSHIGLFIGGVNRAGTAATNSNYSLYPYASAPVDTATSNTANILFNNSVLNIAINNVQYVQNFDTRRFQNAGVVQEGIVLNTSAVDLTNAVAMDNLNGEAGFVPCVPTLQFSGSSKIDVTIQLPSSLTAGVPCQINLIFRGFLSLGASNLNK